MRVAIGQFKELSEERLRFAAQLGASGVLLNTPILPGMQHWDYADLLWLRTRCESHSLRLEALENVPISFYDKAMLGLPGRDEQIEHYQTTIRNMGRADIRVLGYHWMPNGVWRTSFSTPGRGGALVSSFDMALAGADTLTHERVYGEDEMWENYRYFAEAVVPVAQEAGVTLALHPDDPPLTSLGGVARLFRNFAVSARSLAGEWCAIAPDHVLNCLQLFRRERDCGGANIFVYLTDTLGADERHSDVRIGQYPADRKLSGGDAPGSRHDL